MVEVWWLMLLVSSLLMGLVRPDPQVPCYFIFGDSLVDNGNNNYIASLARANYMPYGIDFPGGPSGRFSNGMTTVDVIELILVAILFCLSTSTLRGRGGACARKRD
ncbi:GDSL esterase/lipase At5g45670-like [Elaeis guineensis]|uniref:GDSL esterase/lipase At5g45670-like n=1 Tax=Elaeis guineensis var. tenera TaxID=51953 RepID=UPI003C6D4BA8